MPFEQIHTVIVGGGQAGLAMSEHLGKRGIDHLILERGRIAERWRSARWDSLVANGPAWHDRFPSKEFADIAEDDFATKDQVVAYFEEFADEINAPLRCGVEVESVVNTARGFEVATSNGAFLAQNIVAATGPFQKPVISDLVPQTTPVHQLHSNHYCEEKQLKNGAVLVVGAGSSGVQIADELLRAGRTVYLSVGPHERPPRRYRSKDFVWWLGVLGKWEMTTPPAGKAHVTICVSGAHGGETVDFRRLSERGMNLLGMTQGYENGVLFLKKDLAETIQKGDDSYLSLLKEADQYVERENLDLPVEPDAWEIGPDPACVTNPTSQLDLQATNVTNIIWATGYTQDFGWLKVDTFDEAGKPSHKNGVSKVSGLYFLGLPWLSMRGSSFIWGVWVDAKNIADHIADRRG